jgi:His/Glu/Gln/Arg/opine family amino acid ABC transporter permease subunit
VNYRPDWGVILEFRDLILAGFLTTLGLSLAAIVGSLIFGILFGAARATETKFFRIPATAVVELISNIPILVHIFFWYFAAGLSAIPAALVALISYHGCFVAEVVRSGIQSINPSQIEAARASGLSGWQVQHRIIVPQALMITLPALANEIVSIIKDTAVAMVIGIAELTFASQEIEARTFRGFEAATIVSILYIAITLSASAFVRVLESMTRYREKVI